jgi:hypothetical protein
MRQHRDAHGRSGRLAQVKLRIASKHRKCTMFHSMRNMEVVVQYGVALAGLELSVNLKLCSRRLLLRLQVQRRCCLGPVYPNLLFDT